MGKKSIEDFKKYSTIIQNHIANTFHYDMNFNKKITVDKQTFDFKINCNVKDYRDETKNMLDISQNKSKSRCYYHKLSIIFYNYDCHYLIYAYDPKYLKILNETFEYYNMNIHKKDHFHFDHENNLIINFKTKIDLCCNVDECEFYFYYGHRDDYDLCIIFNGNCLLVKDCFNLANNVKYIKMTTFYDDNDFYTIKQYKHNEVMNYGEWCYKQRVQGVYSSVISVNGEVICG